MGTKLHQPVILISGGSASSASVQAAAAMIAGTGAIPLILTNHLDHVRGMNSDQLFAEIKRITAKCDGVLLMGNDGDIDPGEYGRPNDAKTKSELLNEDGTVNAEGMARRNYEVNLLRAAVEMGMPVMGICCGMQRINVMHRDESLRGTLHQHIPDQMPEGQQHHEHDQRVFGIAPFVAVQPVEIQKGTTLGAIAENIATVYTPARTAGNNITVDVNSMHHQAVAKLGAGLRVAAVSEDKLKDGSRLIEAIEADPSGPYGKQFLVGVQWHPEFLGNALGAKLSNGFSDAARAFARQTNREHTLEDIQQETRLSTLSQLKYNGAEHAVRAGSLTERLLQERSAREVSFGQAV